MRKFEHVSEGNREYQRKGTIPTRATAKSAGYDFHSPISFRLNPGSFQVVWTNIKANLDDNKVLQIYPRSSWAIKKGIVIKNTVGVIDADYYNNQDNEGNIAIALWNTSETTIQVEKGDRIAQGIIYKYYTVDDDETGNERIGGIGSSSGNYTQN